MNDLVSFITNHAVRGECVCGKCGVSDNTPQPCGNTSDVIFFKVMSKNNPDISMLKSLIHSHKGLFKKINLLDGEEHDYMEVGGWIGDQGLALALMGLGELLGLWELLTPRTLLGEFVSEDIVQQMAGIGMIAIKSNNK